MTASTSRLPRLCTPITIVAASSPSSITSTSTGLPPSALALVRSKPTASSRRWRAASASRIAAPSVAATTRSLRVTPSRSPKSSSLSPGGDAGESASTTPSPKRRGDHDRHRRVPADARGAADDRDRDRRDQRARCPAEQQRHPEQRRGDESREERVSERLRAVREFVENDPAAEHTADDPEQHELQQRPLHEAVRPRATSRACISDGGPAGSRSPRRLPGARRSSHRMSARAPRA